VARLIRHADWWPALCGSISGVDSVGPAMGLGEWAALPPGLWHAFVPKGREAGPGPAWAASPARAAASFFSLDTRVQTQIGLQFTCLLSSPGFLLPAKLGLRLLASCWCWVLLLAMLKGCVMDDLAAWTAIDLAVAEDAMKYRWPSEPAKVSLRLKAVSMLQSGSGLKEIGRALSVPPGRVSALLNEAASVTYEVTSFREEFRVIPYAQLKCILLTHGHGIVHGQHGESSGVCDFSTLDEIRAVFSVSPLPVVVDGLGRTGESKVREVLGIELSHARVYKQPSEAAIKSAIGLVERNLSNPLVQQAVARWRALP